MTTETPTIDPHDAAIDAYQNRDPLTKLNDSIGTVKGAVVVVTVLLAVIVFIGAGNLWAVVKTDSYAGTNYVVGKDFNVLAAFMAGGMTALPLLFVLPVLSFIEAWAYTQKRNEAKA